MNKWDLDILVWLSDEQRPITDFLSAPINMTVDWIKMHGGKLAHQDAAVRIKMALVERGVPIPHGVKP